MRRTRRCCARRRRYHWRRGRHRRGHRRDELRCVRRAFREQRFHAGCELVDVAFQRRAQRVQPMRRADEILERLGGHRVFDAEGDDVDPFVDGPLHFPLDLRRGVRVAAEDQNHDLRAVERIDNRLGPRRARRHVARSDPASDAMKRLQLRADGIGDHLVAGGIADEYIVRQRMTS